MKFGLPYQGSKNKLAERIVALLPEAEHLYDVFAGGCAISHCALISGKWNKVHAIDTNDSVLLFDKILNGFFPDGSEWISREEFYRRKDSDPYVRLFWSFSNNQRDYIYSKHLEPYKKVLHEMLYASTPNERRLRFKEVCRLMPDVIGGRNTGEAVYRLQSQESLHPIIPRQCYDMESAERISRLEKPFCVGEYLPSVSDYRDLEILSNSVIYADPPYKGTREYRHDIFDHDAFYDWCGAQTQPLFISEYWMPDDRFECVAAFNRTSTFSATNNSLRKIEKIYRPKHQIQ